MQAALLATKIDNPDIQTVLVTCRRLVERLQLGLRHPLTLLRIQPFLMKDPQINTLITTHSLAEYPCSSLEVVIG